jgi:multidrug resistance efflux pump
MHNKQIEDALFPYNKTIMELNNQLEKAKAELMRMQAALNQAEMYANRYKELRAIGVILAEEGSDPKYLKGEDMDAFFAGIGIYRGATPITDALAKSMQQTKNVMAAHILKEVYDTGSESQSKRDENT